MTRVLHVLGGLGSGGAESLIMNWYRNLDRTRIQFDFLVRSSDRNYAEEIERLGGRVFYTAPFPRELLKNYRQTKEILERREWQAIHVHGNAAIYLLPLGLANRLNYPKIIMHSHSVSVQHPAYYPIHWLNRFRLARMCSCSLACSAAAGKWMFGDRGFSVLKNGVDLEQYRFDGGKRQEIRNRLNLTGKFVVGHVGRFSKPKNHGRILGIFSEILRKKPESVLLLVGDGELEQSIRQTAHSMGLADSVVFSGRQQDVGAYLSAMDVFLFPSLWEGLGNVLIEAQTNGLPCVASREAVVDEVRISEDLHMLSLEQGDEQWAGLVLAVQTDLTRRAQAFSLAEQSGYDIRQVTDRLLEIYGVK